jgi:Dolichyl-phosphate-mannose-protein mannosyltransferase
MSADEPRRASGGKDPLVIGGAAAAILLLIVFAVRVPLLQYVAFRLGAPAGLAIAQMLASIGAGWLVRTTIGHLLRIAPPVETIAFDAVVGYPLFGAITFLVGWFSTAPVVLSALLVVAAVAGVDRLLIGWRSRAAAVEPLSYGIAPALIGGATLMIAAAIAQLPPVALDDVVYHLTIPKTWALEGHVVTLPLSSHSFFPLGCESADLPLLVLGGDGGAIASHLGHFIIAILTIVLFFQFVARRSGTSWATIAAVAVATTPALAISAGFSGTDWALAGCCLALLAALDTDEVSPSAGAALAAGLLVKYTFIPVAAALVAAALLVHREQRRALLKVLGVGALFGSLFFIRNAVVAHNPVAPFFGPLAPSVEGFRTGGWASYLFDPALLDDSLGCVLMAFVFFIPAALRSGRRFASAAAVASFAIALLLATGEPAGRILTAPLIVVAAIAASAAAPGRFLRALFVAMAALQLVVVVEYFDSLEALSVLTGRKSDEEFVAARRGVIPAIRSADAQLPPDARALVLGTNELYWFSHPVRGAGNFDSARLDAYLSSPMFASDLRAEGITHVVIFPAGIRLGGERLTTRQAQRETLLSQPAYLSLRSLLAQSAEVARSPEAVVYRLR